jgi:predicted metalloprotease with PDZ domain
MKQPILFVLLGLLASASATAQSVYLVDIKADGATVEHHGFAAPDANLADGFAATYHLPKTVPGTYATLDYGRFVTDFTAIDAEGKALKVKKKGNNSWEVRGSAAPVTVRYTVASIMELKVKKDKIFEPASTYHDDQKGSVLNGGGVYGFWTGQERGAVTVDLGTPEGWFAATSLEGKAGNGRTKLVASSYHALLDNPVLLTKPDTAGFWVANTRVTIAVLDLNGTPRAADFKRELEADMSAVARFLPQLPVDRYTFLTMVGDFRWAGDVLFSGKPSVGGIIKVVRSLSNQGFGALEHNTSSVYYLGDFGSGERMPEDLRVEKQLLDAAVHEFMHIITPLGLHAPAIHDFDYANPTMSQHLWLYEGVTEYFAQLIRYQGGRLTQQEYLDAMRGKISQGEKFPNSKFSFTEMSRNVLDKPYADAYMHVYDRGAVMAWLIDAQIRSAHQGQRSLIDVIMALHTQYGPERPFDEAGFFDAFCEVAETPGLREFFTKHVEGREALPYAEALKLVGLEYQAKGSEVKAMNPLDAGKNDLKVKAGNLGMSRVVQKVGPNEWAGLQVGDEVAMQDLVAAREAAVDGVMKLPVTRGGSRVVLEVPVKTETVSRPHQLSVANDALWTAFSTRP